MLEQVTTHLREAFSNTVWLGSVQNTYRQFPVNKQRFGDNLDVVHFEKLRSLTWERTELVRDWFNLCSTSLAWSWIMRGEKVCWPSLTPQSTIKSDVRIFHWISKLLKRCGQGCRAWFVHNKMNRLFKRLGGRVPYPHKAHKETRTRYLITLTYTHTHTQVYRNQEHAEAGAVICANMRAV